MVPVGTPTSWQLLFAEARDEYCRCLDELHPVDESHAELLLSDLEPFWVWQYRQTCDLETSLLAVREHGYTFGTDNPRLVGGVGADRTILAYGRSSQNVTLDSLLTRLSGTSTGLEQHDSDRSSLIARIGWLRWDHFEAMPRHLRKEYRRAELEIAVALGLPHLIAAATRSRPHVRLAVDAHVRSATGRDLTADPAWFATWAHTHKLDIVPALSRDVTVMLDPPPVVLEGVLHTADAPACIALMKDLLVPLITHFDGNRPRALRSQTHFRYSRTPVTFALDVGHLIAHAAAGPPDINFFPQRRDLNRGWSSAGDGRAYRALERYVANNPGTAYFSRLLYDSSETGLPHFIEMGLIVDRDSLPMLAKSIPIADAAVQVCTSNAAGTAIVVGAFDNFTGELVHVRWRPR
jgi:hypothetical protein